MHTGLVQWVQWTKDSQTEAKSLRALHGEPWEIRIPPEYQAASTLENKLSFLTKAIHDTAWNTFVADVQVLRSRGCRDLGTELDHLLSEP